MRGLQNAKRPGGSPGEIANGNILKFDSATKSTSEQDRLDVERENRIDRLRLELLAKLSTDERHMLWTRLKSEIAARSTAVQRRRELDLINQMESSKQLSRSEAEYLRAAVDKVLPA